MMVSTALLGSLLAGCSSKSDSSKTTTETTSKKDLTEKETAKYQKSLNKFASRLEKQMEKDGIPSASISVTENGKTIYSKGFGYANLENKVPVDENSLFYSGSVGKVYGTAALLKLIQDHDLSLDDPVIKHLPEFQMADSRHKDITLRMLLNHTAGLPSDVNATSLSAGTTMPDNVGRDLFKELTTQSLRSVPGDYAVYSNIGFELAQKVVEKISGKTFRAYLKEEFFEPLNLKNTFMASEENEEVANDRFVLPINSEGRSLPREYASHSMDATGAILSTTEDTCKFVDGILSPDSNILNEDSIAEFTKDQSLTAKFPEQQELNALGWDEMSRTITETPVYDKSGASTIFSSKVITAPEAGITIAGSLTQFHNPFIYEELKTLMYDILLEKEAITKKEGIPVYPEEANTSTDNTTYNGIYTGGENIHDLASLIKIETDKNKLERYLWNGVEWQNTGSYPLREDGSYGSFDKENNLYTSYSFESQGEDNYLKKRVISPDYDTTTAVAKRIPEKNAVESWEKYNNQLWLRTNIWPSDYQASSCFSLLQTMDELPGYVAINGGAPIMNIKSETKISSIENLPAGAGHADLNFTNNHFSWIGMDFINASEAQEFPVNDATISLEKANTAQWYFISEDTEIDIDVPFNKVRILNVSPELAINYDNLNGSSPFKAKAGSYIGISSIDPTSVNVKITPLK